MDAIFPTVHKYAQTLDKVIDRMTDELSQFIYKWCSVVSMYNRAYVPLTRVNTLPSSIVFGEHENLSESGPWSSVLPSMLYSVHI